MSRGASPYSAPVRQPAVPKMVSRVAVVAALELRAAAIEASVEDTRIMPHSRMLPTEAEQDQARFAARQLRAAALDLQAGLEDEHG